MEKIKRVFWYILFFVPCLILWSGAKAVADYWYIHGKIFDEAEKPSPPIRENN